MLTPFGKAARKWRIDNDMNMKAMADDLGVSVAYLSAIEHGHKNLDAGTPIVSRLPADLRRTVYELMLSKHSAECERLRELLTQE